MNLNIFFDLNRLGKIGENVIIGKTVRIRYPELVKIGNNVIIDDFTYISTKLIIGNYVHIAAGSKIIGGFNSLVSIGDYSTLAPNVVLAAGSDDYVSGIASPLVPSEFKGKVQIGSIKINRHCIIGTNSTILPNVTLQDGAAVGAQSLVKSDIPGWTLHAGVPARHIKAREKDEILRLEQLHEGRKK
jgi:acetyltransferase-like isoleucine patch superfamily enzyme